MINDIKAVNPSGNLLVKYADDISLSIPVGAKLSQADSEIEVKSIMEWAKNNRISLNLGKTWEMLMKGKTEKDQPDPLQYIKRKSNLKLLGPFQTSNFSCAESNANEKNLLFSLICIRFGT